MKDYNVFIDFETRSLTNLLVTGAWKYAACPSTYPLMLAAYYPVSGRALQWLEYKHGRECPSWVRDIAEDPEVIVHAHNANFEIGIWRRALVERWGWPDIPTERWCDTAGKASHANRPRSLAMLARNLKVKDKDKKGKGLIKLLSMPQKAVKTVKDTNGNERHDSFAWLEANGVEVFEQDPTDGPIWFWNDEAKPLADFAKYNENDVLVEHACDERLPDYSATEAAVWALDSKINERGIPVDRELCDAACELFEYLYDRCEVEIQTLTNGEIRSPSQAEKVKDWIERRDPTFGRSLAKDYVEAWLERFEELPEDDKTPELHEVASILDIRQIYGGAAVKKYAAALDKIEDDDRVRGEFIYHKASTGRWAGSGIQVQNLFRQAIPSEEVFELVKSANFDVIREYCDLLDVFLGSFVRSCVRGLIQAPEGKTLIVSDFAGIESRVLQWLAGNEEALQLFRDGKDAYVHTAAKMYGLNYDDMMGPNEEGEMKVLPEFKEERQVGKAAVLGLGYQMGAAKFTGELKKNGVADADEGFAKEIVDKWRKANPLIACYNTGLWARVQRAAIMVVKNKKPDLAAKVRTHGAPHRFLRFAWEGDALTIQLPSGRKLYYPDAMITEGRFGGDALRYRDGGKMIVDTYGGKLIENIIQAISRDLLVNSAFLAEARPDLIMLIMHVHDELVGEASEDRQQDAFDFLHKCMSTIPDWATSLPLAAETYISKRYTK